MDVMTPDTLNTSMIFNNAPVHLQKYKLNYYNRTIKKRKRLNKYIFYSSISLLTFAAKK